MNDVEIKKTYCYGSINENTLTFDDQEFFDTLIIFYKLHKIKCYTKYNSGIAGIEIAYKNINTGEEQTTINIKQKEKSKDKFIEQEFNFEPTEYIIKFILWTGDSLNGFEITTNKKRSQRFGKDSGYQKEIDELTISKSIILGFFIKYDTKNGVTGIGFYYMNLKIFWLLHVNGLFQLRAKIKNKNFKKETERKINYKEIPFKYVYYTCLLPDVAFYGVVKYIFG